MKKYSKAFIISGGVLLIIAASYLLLHRNSKNSPWTIKVHGNHLINETELIGLVSHYIQNNAESISGGDIQKLLTLNPRIKTADVEIHGKRIEIELTEHEIGYLSHSNNHVSESTLSGKILQENVEELGYLIPDQPIFYLTAQKDNEIKTLKSDIIRLWDQTKYSYSFIWTRISEIALGKDEAGQLETIFFTVQPAAKIRMNGRFTKESFKRLWAILYYLEGLSLNKMADVQVFDDHAVVL